MSRWTLREVATDETWTMPISPDSMTSPEPKRALRTAGRQARKRVFQTPPPPRDWEWGGVIRTKQHHDTLLAWSLKDAEIDVTDHLDRTYRVAITEFSPTDRASTPRTPWRQRYTMKATILGRIA